MSPITNFNELERQKKRVSGKWKIDDRHRLTYQADEDKEQMELEASLVAAEPEALVIAVTEKKENGNVVTSTARLAGHWQANHKNQLEFEVERSSGKHDVLTFTGTWKDGLLNEIVYSYRTAGTRWVAGGRRLRTQKLATLTLRGVWSMTDQNQLVYLMEGDSHSEFRFRGALQTKSILAKKGELRYQLGAEARTRRDARRKRKQVVCLFGVWKVSDQMALDFEMSYEDGQKHTLSFGAEFSITKSMSIGARLMTKTGSSLGVEVILTKELFKGNGEGFVRLRKSLEESSMEAGVEIQW